MNDNNYNNEHNNYNNNYTGNGNDNENNFVVKFSSNYQLKNRIKPIHFNY